MTTAAMVVGMVPLLIASGAGAASRFSIGLVIAAGMTIGTLFTLFVTPAVYTYVARDHQKVRAQAEAAEAAKASIARARDPWPRPRSAAEAGDAVPGSGQALALGRRPIFAGRAGLRAPPPVAASGPGHERRAAKRSGSVGAGATRRLRNRAGLHPLRRI